MKRVVNRAARSPYAIGAALVALALVYRLVLLRTALATVDSDEAVLGIMARHILRGARPVFFYGQSYQGALEAYLTAGVFRLWGQSDLTLRLVPALVSALLAAQLYGLARLLYGPRVALVTGLWAALPAPLLAYWGTFAGAGYVEVLALGTGLCAIAIRRWGLGRRRGYDWPALGLLAGLGLWVHPVILYYLVALLLAGAPLAWRLYRRSHPSLVPSVSPSPGLRAALLPSARRAGPTLACFALGGAPWWGYTLRHGVAGFGVLGGHFAPGLLWDTVQRLGSETLPLLVGGGLPATEADAFVGYVNGHTFTYALAIVALCYLGVRLVVSPGGLAAQARALVAGRPLADAPLALLLPITLALYLASRFEALPWTTHNPRYLLPLYTALPYLLACAVPVSTRAAALRRVRRWRRLAAYPARIWRGVPWLREMGGLYADGVRALARPALALALAVAVAVNVFGTAHYQSPPRVAPLAAALVARGDGAVYCLYWLAWRLSFESGERLTPVATNGLAVDPRSNVNRYPPYLARAAQARRWAYILPYDVGAPQLVALLGRLHVPYQRWRWGNASVFDGPSGPRFPPTLAPSPPPAPPPGLAAGATR